MGQFELGMILGDALDYIQRYPVDFSRVCLKYHPMRPYGTDVTLDLDHQGFLLRFDPRQQRLRQIEVYNVQAIGSLSFKGNVFCRPHELATCHRVCERFGPTVPGEYCPRKRVYKLHYPGVSFFFPIPDEYARFCPGAGSGPQEDSLFMPLEFPGGLSPVASRIVLFCGGDPRLDAPFLPPLPRDSQYFEEVSAVVGTGIHFTARQKTVTFQSSVQDVLTAIGSPDKVFFKDTESLQLHLDQPEASCHSASVSSDYFFNYFALGIDLLFDQHTHFVKKIVLHSNLPCHFDFNRYRKCNFQIINLQPVPLSNAPPPPPSSSSSSSSDPSVLSSISVPIPADQIQERLRKLDEFQLRGWSPINADSHWHDVMLFFPVVPGRPVVDNRGSNDNPFGPRRFYGFTDVIFEVIRNDYIASVILFSSDPLLKRT
ncbi:MAG: hypothetical protein Q8P67_10245 [archaeon]|nr:hypothetical protein [archaeon]